MKTSIILSLAALATSVFALPEPIAGVKHYGGKGGNWGNGKDGPIKFTSKYSVVAKPNQVVNTTESGDFEYTGGLKGAIGYYDFGINSDYNVICWQIRLNGFRGKYESAADTATHIHEAPKGKAGPPRIAFPNPVRTGNGDERVSIGCLKGPFETGVENADTGMDTGAGFHVSQIEKNPAAFFCDVHSSLAVPGAVRGQLR